MTCKFYLSIIRALDDSIWDNSMSIIEVAKAAGVSHATVSYVINGKPGVSPKTAKRVEQAMKRLNYVPKPLASRSGPKKVDLNGLKHGCVGVVFYGQHTNMVNYPFYASLVHAVEEELSERNLSMMVLCFSNFDESVNSYKIDGGIVCGEQNIYPQNISVPFVSVFGHPDLYEDPICDHVEPANDRIGIMAADYLVSKGHKKIGYINPVMPGVRHLPIETRQRFFVDYCSRFNCEYEIYDVPFSERKPGGGLYEYDEIPVLESFLDEFCQKTDRPTGVFVPMDAHMVVIQKGLRQKGVIPGQDIELVGCNNEKPFLEGLDPRPATIDVNAEQIAKSLVERLLYRIGDRANHQDFIQINVLPKLVQAGSGVKEQW